MSRSVALTLAVLVLCIAGALTGYAIWATQHPASAPSLVGGPFALIDQNGHPTTDGDLKGEPSIVFFGFTHCPDICPTVLSDLTSVLEILGKDAKIRAAFITVDPERDTPAVLKEYLSNFDPRIVGLTGSTEAIAAVERAYRVYAKKVPTKDGSYTMDHTAIVYLMGRDGHFIQALNLEQAPDKAAAELQAAITSATS